MGNQNLFTPY